MVELVLKAVGAYLLLTALIYLIWLLARGPEGGEVVLQIAFFYLPESTVSEFADWLSSRIL